MRAVRIRPWRAGVGRARPIQPGRSQFGAGLHSRVANVDDVCRRQLEAYMNGIATARDGLGEYERASQEFEKSRTLGPDNAWVYFNQAEAYRGRGDRLNAAEKYRIALSKKEPKLTALKRTRAKKMLERFAS
jgi:tetratricopeptide (TPR) repeat protein